MMVRHEIVESRRETGAWNPIIPSRLNGSCGTITAVLRASQRARQGAYIVNRIVDHISFSDKSQENAASRPAACQTTRHGGHKTRGSPPRFTELTLFIHASA